MIRQPSPFSLAGAALLATALLAAGWTSTAPARPLAALHSDSVLLAAPDVFRAELQRLVEEGDVERARRLWAHRSLLPEPPDDTFSLGQHRSQQLRAAAKRFRNSDRQARDWYRLALTLTDARWHEAARMTAREATRRDAELQGAQQLAATLENLQAFADELRSAAEGVHARANDGIIESAELREIAQDLMRSYGYTIETLLRRGLYLTTVPSAAHPDLWEVRLAAVADHHPARAIERPDGVIRVRRVLVDDDRLPRFGEAFLNPWTTSPTFSRQDRDLTVYHRLDPLRRTGVELFVFLERRGGSPVRSVADLEGPIVGTEAWPPSLGRPATPIEATDVQLDVCSPRLADALRVRVAQPLFDEVRAAGSFRVEMRRRFVRGLIDRRLDVIEARIARMRLDQIAGAAGGAQRRLERQLLDALAYEPMRLWQLAQLVDRGCEPDSGPPQLAARAVLRQLRRFLGWSTPDDVLAVADGELERAARAIIEDRFGTL